MSYATPFLRWAGSKRKFIKEYGELFPKRKRLIDPFLGGGSIPLFYGSTSFSPMLLGDVVPDLVCAYRAVKEKKNDLLGALKALQDFGTTKEAYYAVRDTLADNDTDRAARFIYLNKLCFNGLYRENSKGVFNVPYGGQEKEIYSVEVIEAASLALTEAEIFETDFETLINEAKEGDLVYADPPYDGVYSDYSEKRFGPEDQRRLASALYAAKKRGATIIAHNSESVRVKKLYQTWTEMMSIGEARMINSDGKGRGKIDCVLICA